MNSYGVRCIFKLPKEDINNKKYVYEERITIWQATTIDDALDLAVTEAKEYSSRINGSEFTGLSQAFFMFKPVEKNGVEVFSLLRESDLETDDYLDTFFSTGNERQKK